MKHPKIFISILIVILLAIIVLADPNSPSGFGNQTDVTAWIGGKFGILNVTGRIVSQNDTWCNSTTCKSLSSFVDVTGDSMSGNLNMSENNITDVDRIGIGIGEPQRLIHMVGDGTANTGWARFGLSTSEYTEIGHRGTNSAINAVGDGDLDFRHDGVTGMSLTDDKELIINNNLTVNNTITTTSFITKDPVIDIRSYGAIADDGLDDVYEIQNILDNYTSNVKIFIPCGTFNFGGKLNFTSSHQHITFEGNGVCSEFKLMSGVDTNMINLEGADYITLKDFQIDGSRKVNAIDHDVIRTGFNANNNQFINLYIHNTSGSGILLNRVKNNLIENCRFEDLSNESGSQASSGMAVKLSGSRSVTVVNNYIDTYWGNGGIFAYPSGTSKVQGYHIIDGNTIRKGMTDESSGITMTTNHSTITNNVVKDMPLQDPYLGTNGIRLGINSYGNVVSNNIVENISGVLIEIDSDFTTVTGNRGNGTGNGSGIYVKGDVITLTGNIINNAEHSVLIDGVGRNIDINNNIFMNSQNDGAGVRILATTEVRNVMIHNNIINDNRTIPIQDYGVYVTGSGILKNIQVYGNYYENMQTADVAGLPDSQVNFNSDLNMTSNVIFFGNGGCQCQNSTGHFLIETTCDKCLLI